MIKVLEFFNKRADLSHEDFLRYWRGRHTSVVMGITGIRRYMQNPVRHDLLAGQPFDGIVEVWFSGLEMMRSNAKSPYWPLVEADEAQFIDRAGARLMLIDDPVPPPAVAGQRVFVLFKIADSASVESRDADLADLAAVPGAQVDQPFQRRREQSIADVVLSISGSEEWIKELLIARPWSGLSAMKEISTLVADCRPILVE